MLSIKACKQVLNKKGEKYTDEQIDEIRDLVQILAEVFVNNLNQNDHEQKGCDLYQGID